MVDQESELIADGVLPTTTMGALANWEPPPAEEEFYRNIIKVLDDFYPENWRSWVVNDVSYEKISSSEENCFRFAIPTVRLAQAYKAISLSERQYKLIKQILLTWPLGRALIYSPHATMKLSHPEAYSCFLQNVLNIKQHLIPRQQAAEVMKSQLKTPILISSRSLASTSQSQIHTWKINHSPERSSSKLASLMERQNEVMTKLLKLSRLATKILTKDKSTPLETETVIGSGDNEDNVTDGCTAPGVNPQIPVDVAQSPDVPEEEFFDFSEAKLATANEVLAKQGTNCQRLGEPTWRDVRYEDVQKRFHATPVFTNLKVNSNLATVTPNSQTIALLEKMDACLGAITHGLLQERNYFQGIYDKASLKTKYYISKNFLAKDSPFRKTSDALLQYTCGQRAEIIQQRRLVYEPPDETLNERLHAIPPSNTHLFSEPQLSDLVEEQGGSDKFFPFREQALPTSSSSRQEYKRSANNNAEKRQTKPRKNKKDKPRHTERRNTTHKRTEQTSRKRHSTDATTRKFKKPKDGKSS